MLLLNIIEQRPSVLASWRPISVLCEHDVTHLTGDLGAYLARARSMRIRPRPRAPVLSVFSKWTLDFFSKASRRRRVVLRHAPRPCVSQGGDHAGRLVQ
jgi:hypothetical protein